MIDDLRLSASASLNDSSGYSLRAYLADHAKNLNQNTPMQITAMKPKLTVHSGTKLPSANARKTNQCGATAACVRVSASQSADWLRLSISASSSIPNSLDGRPHLEHTGSPDPIRLVQFEHLTTSNFGTMLYVIAFLKPQTKTQISRYAAALR